MVIVIAAGGKGTRIQSLNANVPKPMIPIAGKPILQWEIECLVAQGYKEFVITVSYKKEAIIDYFGDGSPFGCHIEYFEEGQPLGNFGAVYKLWGGGRLTDTFLFLIADAIFDFSVDRMLKYHEDHHALATLFIHPNSHPYDSGLVVTGEGNVVTNWLNKEDKRPKYYRNSVNAGIQFLTVPLLEQSGIDAATVGANKGQRKVDLDRDVLKPLISTGRIYAYHSSEYVKDAGTPGRFQAVQADIKAGRVASRNLVRPQKAVFLDRDGTINKYVGFLTDMDDLALLPRVTEAIRRINNSGYLCIVATNQPVIARGEVTEAGLQQIHNKMETLLGEDGAYVDAIYYCPHHPDRGFEGEVESLKIDCDCRKPKPGLLFRAAQDFNIDLKSSWIIGDSWRDIAAGQAAGCSTIFLNGEAAESGTTSHSLSAISADERNRGHTPDLVASDLLYAVKMILCYNSASHQAT